ncbi:DUF3040 domain-containing protein [Pseudonocardia sp. KRD-182]|uniref:DUF3040 domain-containing protein n=1 Tax=Pseudonocardia oceani TaxID=2792013 RepID=UPI001C49CFC1|nr:DUF3040 domain-containing protein [Pseudonocardia oceani]MBW0108591.1 DUF3040 domain-containing protein [Pseudonocardia oceani]
MLSDRERRVLQEVERGIAEEDPKLAARLRRWPSNRARRLGDAVIVLAAGTAVLCLVLSAVLAGLVAGTLAVVLVVRRRRRRRGRSAGGLSRWWWWCTSGDGSTGESG